MINIDRHDLPEEIYETIRLIGRKHAFKILHFLAHNPLSFNEIKTELNISASMLSDLLSDFQMRNIIEKKQISVSPARYAYYMNDFGKILCNIIEDLTEWGSGMLEATRSISITKVDVES